MTATVLAMRIFIAILMKPGAISWMTIFIGSFDCYSCTSVPPIRNISFIFFSLCTYSMSWRQATCVTSSQRCFQRVETHTKSSMIMRPNLSIFSDSVLKIGNNVRKTSVFVPRPY
jgi:hypothetical protein